MRRTVVQGNSWRRGAGIDRIRQEELVTEQGEAVGDGRAEELSAIVDGGRAAVLLTPEADGTHLHIFASLQLKSSGVEDFPGTSL